IEQNGDDEKENADGIAHHIPKPGGPDGFPAQSTPQTETGDYITDSDRKPDKNCHTNDIDDKICDYFRQEPTYDQQKQKGCRQTNRPTGSCPKPANTHDAQYKIKTVCVKQTVFIQEAKGLFPSCDTLRIDGFRD
ncbi:MAG: hypothetical protein LUH46_03155, partial [Alistipes sp.]|nr:hypothetical protein [Alistipes sp.]